MSIRISEHILSLDDNILGVSLFSSQFHMVESATRPGFEKRFTVTADIERSGPSYAATIYGMARLLEGTFGTVEKITSDYRDAKLLLLALKNSGFVGLVLNKMVNSDLLAQKITAELDDTNEVIGMML